MIHQSQEPEVTDSVTFNDTLDVNGNTVITGNLETYNEVSQVVILLKWSINNKYVCK